MAGIDQVRLLLKELGPGLELGEIQEDPGGSSWGLATRDGVIFYLEFMAGRRPAVAVGRGRHAATGRPRRAPSTDAAIQCQWRRTGGVRLALDGPDDAVVLAYDLPAAGLDLPRLCTIVGNFRNMIDGWRKIVEGTAAPDKAAPAAAGAVIRG